jgi:hypothetical protein
LAEIIKVVVRYANGKVMKGTTHDFFPNRPAFHVVAEEGGATVKVLCKELKALFFVKDFAGDAARQDLRGFVDGPVETATGKKVAVRFRDGELVCGYTLSYSSDRDGFFLFPADPGSNNLRVYVVTAATKEIKAGPAAEALAQKALDSGAR